MSGCLGAHHSTAVSRGPLRSRRPTLSLAGATPAMPATSLVTFPDAGRCLDLGISPGDSVVVVTVAGVADKFRRACRPAEPGGLRATFLLVKASSPVPSAGSALRACVKAGDDAALVRERRGTTPLAAPWRGRSIEAVTGLPVRFYWAWLAVLPKAPR